MLPLFGLKNSNHRHFNNIKKKQFKLHCTEKHIILEYSLECENITVFIMLNICLRQKINKNQYTKHTFVHFPSNKHLVLNIFLTIYKIALNDWLYLLIYKHRSGTCIIILLFLYKRTENGCTILYCWQWLTVMYLYMTGNIPLFICTEMT